MWDEPPAPDPDSPVAGGPATPPAQSSGVRTPLAVPDAPEPPPPAPPPGLPDGFGGVGAVIVGAGGADLAATPGGEPFVRARQGLVLAGQGLSADREWVQVFHMCDGTAWVSTDEIGAVLPAGDGEVGVEFDFADAVLVIDPGHGGSGNPGAQSPDGLIEKGINLDIAARVRDLLAAPHSVDWETGTVLVGDDVPAVRDVVLTRSGADAAADYEAGLLFRAAVADALDAHAMVSIHNNAGWQISTDEVGSDVYYQSQRPVRPESRRLAVLLVEEFRRGFAGFDADWVGSAELGAKSRLSPRDDVSQYYGLLRAAGVPTVIAEGAYIANPAEAALLRTPEFRQAYAEAVYRALIRFVTTDDAGDAASYDPEVWHGSAGRGGARAECVIPSQG
jgi:N-acetylmuramoyl-L-alanine amidase